MAIDRDGKHWCEPAAETPDENGRFVCSCGNVWTYEPAERLWSPAAADPEAAATSPAATKRRTRTGKGGAE